MKQLLMTIAFLLLTPAVYSQKLTPEIKQGTILNYNVYLKNTGNNVILALTFNGMDGPIQMQWDVPGYGKGEWEMPAASLASAIKTTLSPPEPDKITKIKPDETLLFLSKALYTEAVKNNRFVLNGIEFNVIADTATYKINDKPISAFHAISENKKVELWVLNNPNYPLLCLGKNITKGIDFSLFDIKQKP